MGVNSDDHNIRLPAAVVLKLLRDENAARLYQRRLFLLYRQTIVNRRRRQPPSSANCFGIRPQAFGMHALMALNRVTDCKQYLPELRKMVNDESVYNRYLVAIALGAMGPAATASLIALLDDSDIQVRAAAADSLGRIGPAAKDAAPALKRLLGDMHEVYDLQGRVCNHAGEAMASILGDKSYLKGLPPMPVDGK